MRPGTVTEAILKLLLDAGADPNGAFNSDTALHMAAERGRLGSVKLLVGAGADVNALNRFREPAVQDPKRLQRPSRGFEVRCLIGRFNFARTQAHFIVKVREDEGMAEGICFRPLCNVFCCMAYSCSRDGE